MEFWGVEVKAGEKLKVEPEMGKLIHISQAAMGEVKDVKGAKNVHLRMKINDQNFIIGSLAAGERTQVMFDLVFEKEFELSHDLKSGSVYFIGYAADEPVSEGEEYSDFDDSEDEEEPIAAQPKENGTAKAKPADVKPAAAAKVKKEEKVPLKVEEDSDSDEDDSDDEMAIDGMQEDDSDVSGDSDDEEDEDDSSEEEELPKPNLSKKRPAAIAEKTPTAKKPKAATPEKSGQSGKKGQNATPIPAKSAGKTPNKPNQNQKGQSPKSGGQASGKFQNNKNFSSGKKGKHGGK